MSVEICDSWELFLEKIDFLQYEIITEISWNKSFNASYINRSFFRNVKQFQVLLWFCCGGNFRCWAFSTLTLESKSTQIIVWNPLRVIVHKCQAILHNVLILQWMSSVTFGILTGTVFHKIRYKPAAKILNHEVLGCYES